MHKDSPNGVLGELVVAVRADGQPFHGADHLITRRVLGGVRRFEERAGAREFVALAPRGTGNGPHPVVGRATGWRGSLSGRRRRGQRVVTDGIAAT